MHCVKRSKCSLQFCFNHSDIIGCQVVPVNLHLITCYYFQKAFWGCLKPLLRVHVHMVLLLLTQQTRHKTDTRHMFRLSLKMLWTDPNKISNLFTTSEIVSLWFKGNILSLNPHFRVFCLLVGITKFAIFNMDHTPLELVKPYKKLVFFPLPALQQLFPTLQMFLHLSLIHSQI